MKTWFRPRPAAKARLDLEALDAREMPAVVTLNSAGILFIDGTDQREAVSVTSALGKVRVSVATNPPPSGPAVAKVDTFNAAAVKSITFIGKGGDDRFTNFTAIRSAANGGLGNDRLRGGTGNDSLNGSLGNDILGGGAGNDILIGDVGNDVLLGEAGNDTLYGLAGSDTMFGGDGNDILVGGDGHDVQHGGNGNDLLVGGNGNDQMYGGNGADDLRGEAGNDWLDGGKDGVFDKLRGGTGADRFGTDIKWVFDGTIYFPVNVDAPFDLKFSEGDMLW
jgi:Ca2+-binding RTX toxin-like protein